MTIVEKNTIANSYKQNIMMNIPRRIKNSYQTEFEIIMENASRSKS